MAPSATSALDAVSELPLDTPPALDSGALQEGESTTVEEEAEIESGPETLSTLSIYKLAKFLRPELISILERENFKQMSSKFYKDEGADDSEKPIDTAKILYEHVLLEKRIQDTVVCIQKSINRWITSDMLMHLPVGEGWNCGDDPRFQEDNNVFTCLSDDYDFESDGNKEMSSTNEVKISKPSTARCLYQMDFINTIILSFFQKEDKLARDAYERRLRLVFSSIVNDVNNLPSTALKTKYASEEIMKEEEKEEQMETLVEIEALKLTVFNLEGFLKLTDKSGKRNKKTKLVLEEIRQRQGKLKELEGSERGQQAQSKKPMLGKGEKTKLDRMAEIEANTVTLDLLQSTTKDLVFGIFANNEVRSFFEKLRRRIKRLKKEMKKRDERIKAKEAGKTDEEKQEDALKKELENRRWKSNPCPLYPFYPFALDASHVGCSCVDWSASKGDTLQYRACTRTVPSPSDKFYFACTVRGCISVAKENKDAISSEDATLKGFDLGAEENTNDSSNRSTDITIKHSQCVALYANGYVSNSKKLETEKELNFDKMIEKVRIDVQDEDNKENKECQFLESNFFPEWSCRNNLECEIIKVLEPVLLTMEEVRLFKKMENPESVRSDQDDDDLLQMDALVKSLKRNAEEIRNMEREKFQEMENGAAWGTEKMLENLKDAKRKEKHPVQVHKNDFLEEQNKVLENKRKMEEEAKAERENLRMQHIAQMNNPDLDEGVDIKQSAPSHWEKLKASGAWVKSSQVMAQAAKEMKKKVFKKFEGMRKHMDD
eukprot:g3728.t1